MRRIVVAFSILTAAAAPRAASVQSKQVLIKRSVGCVSKDDINRIAEIAATGDRGGFEDFISSKVQLRACRYFDVGEFAFLVDMASTNPAFGCLRLVGETMSGDGFG